MENAHEMAWLCRLGNLLWAYQASQSPTLFISAVFPTAPLPLLCSWIRFEEQPEVTAKLIERYLDVENNFAPLWDANSSEDQASHLSIFETLHCR